MWRDENVVNGTPYCYRMIGVNASGHQSGWGEVSCLTPKADPIPPVGTASLDGAAFHGQSLRLRIQATDAPADAHNESAEEPPVGEGAVVSGVVEMQLSNRPDFAGAAWEPYQTEKTWRPSWAGGQATVFIRFRDRAGNVSDVVAQTFAVSTALHYLPMILR
jgi:hypothetical protein